MRKGLSRRGLFGCLCSAGAAAPLRHWRPALAAGPAAKTTLTADQALAMLKEGNANFKADRPVQNSNLTRERRIEIAAGQTPFAVLVSCSDSRVPPELLFGRGLGELFIVRNAGNTLDTTALGSVEYAVAELGVPLVVVMGHERCGAVAAAVQSVTEGTSFPGAIGQMIEPIIPAVLTAQRRGGGDLLDTAVRENVRRTVTNLRKASEPMLMGPMREGKMKVVGARYDLNDGSVDFFDEG